MKINKIAKIALALTLSVGFAQSSNTIMAKAKTKAITPYMIAGEISLVKGNEVFAAKGSTMSAKDLLIASEFDAGYVITGMEADYYTEKASVPAELAILLNDRVTFQQSELDKVANATQLGVIKIKGTYFNDLVQHINANGGYQDFEILVNIVDSENTVYSDDPNNTTLAAINAKNFELKIEDASNFDATKAKNVAESEFRSWDVSREAFASYVPGKDLASLVDVNASQLAAINGAKKGGVYRLEYSITYYDNITLTKSINVFVSDKNTKIDRAQELAIFADDFEIDKDDVANLDDDAVMKLIDAKAHNYKNGAKLDATKISVDYSKLVKDASNMKSATMKANATSAVVVTYDDGAGKSIATSVSVNITSKTPPSKQPGDNGGIKPSTPKDPEKPIDRGSDLPNAGDASLVVSAFAGIISILSITALNRLKTRNYNL